MAVYICGDSSCQFEYSSVDNLEHHVSTFHCEYTPFECSICRARLSTQQRLSQHWLKHHDRKGTPISVLHFDQWKHEHMRLLMVRSREKVDNAPTPSITDTDSVTVKAEIVEHGDCDPENARSSMDDLMHSYSRRGQQKKRNSSIRSAMISESAKAGEPPITVTDCRSAPQYSRQMPTPHSEPHQRTFKCLHLIPNHTSKRSNAYTSFRTTPANVQMPTPHSEPHQRTFKCQSCDMTFTRSILLARHVRRHRPFKCEHCAQCFVDQHSLAAHALTHSDTPVNRCEISEAGDTNPGELLRQKKTENTTQLPLKCSFCEKRFKLVGLKTNHERSHTGSRPFECVLCEWAFAEYRSLVRHERTVHKGIGCGGSGRPRRGVSDLKTLGGLI